jgi:hypothetical protein
LYKVSPYEVTRKLNQLVSNQCYDSCFEILGADDNDKTIARFLVMGGFVFNWIFWVKWLINAYPKEELDNELVLGLVNVICRAGINGIELKIEDVKVKNQEVEKMLGSIKNGENQRNELTPEEKLNNLLSKLDVELNENVKIKDESENVIEVGPQNVETEKIKLNIKDVDGNKDVENLDELKNNEGQLINIKENEVDKLDDVEKIRDDKTEDVDELGAFENKFLENHKERS